MRITLAQKAALIKYGVKIYDDVDETLIAISDRILEIGFLPGDDYDLLNKTGLKMRKLYDELYEQNRYGDVED